MATDNPYSNGAPGMELAGAAQYPNVPGGVPGFYNHPPVPSDGNPNGDGSATGDSMGYDPAQASENAYSNRTQRGQ